MAPPIRKELPILGGGIFNRGTLTITNSTVSGNTGVQGSGIHNFTGDLTLTNSTVSGNTAEGSGGGIVNEGTEGMLTLTNSTVSGNSAMEYGGIFNIDGTLTLTNGLVDGDCGGAVTCGFDQEGDQAGVSTALLDLQSLADNGGPTMTHAITTDSVAFNAGTCEVDKDQRGVERPQGAACDVGAFELEQPLVQPANTTCVHPMRAHALNVKPAHGSLRFLCKTGLPTGTPDAPT